MSSRIENDDIAIPTFPLCVPGCRSQQNSNRCAQLCAAKKKMHENVLA